MSEGLPTASDFLTAGRGPGGEEASVPFRSSSTLGRFGEVVGIDVEGDEHLIMLDDFECLAVPMRRVEWRKLAT